MLAIHHKYSTDVRATYISALFYVLLKACRGNVKKWVQLEKTSAVLVTEVVDLETNIYM